MVYEIVVDLSAPRPRLAYLREISWFRITALIAANTQVTDTPDPEMQPQDADAVPIDEAGDDPAVPETRSRRRIGRWTAG
jgi:hypothetical protein